jgi:hypothetical protein
MTKRFGAALRAIHEVALDAEKEATRLELLEASATQARAKADALDDAWRLLSSLTDLVSTVKGIQND